MIRRLYYRLWRLFIIARFAATGDCGLSCGVTEPYGFVPECDCPIHDLGLKSSEAQAQEGNRVKDEQEFIKYSRADVPALVAEVERLRASLEEILDEATSDLDRDIIITECQSALSPPDALPCGHPREDTKEQAQ